jgi:hypothetical protein
MSSDCTCLVGRGPYEYMWRDMWRGAGDGSGAGDGVELGMGVAGCVCVVVL